MYTSIINNNTFLQQKLPLTAPDLLSLLTDAFILGAADGLLCFLCYGGLNSKKMVVVIWNPSVRKSVAIDIPSQKSRCYTIVGFGVYPDTSVPRLVKIIVDRKASMWEVEIFTLSTRVWKTVYTSLPYKYRDLSLIQVFVDGATYFHAYDDVFLDPGSQFNFVILFDFKSEKFSEVCLPERLLHTPDLDVAKANESLGLLEYYDEGEMSVCGVWSRKDGADKPFTKIYIVKVEGKWLDERVLEFRNNGEVVMELDTDNYEESRIEVYESLSGYTHGVGINGKRYTFSARSYIETLLLLDESDSITH